MSTTTQVPDPNHPLLPLARAYTSYFTPKVSGLENLPASGPALVIGNHSSIYWAPEVWITFMAMMERRPTEPTFGVAHEILLRAPFLGDSLRQFGVIPASQEAAAAGLKDGGAVMVYPGGDWEACRPWTERGKIDFAGRKGFIRLALKLGVPVIPAVANGGHDSIFILSRGERTAKLLQLDKLFRAKVFPYTVGLPFGVAPVIPQIPLPATVDVSFLPPLDWSTEPGDPEDTAAVAAHYESTVRTMQTELDRLRAETPNPVSAGIKNHLAALPGPLSGLANLL
ncbi:2-acyl-glycerophospho-ethanolamine acyltransferase [Nocardia otitidiscaviarum]|uniref:2-acyl-glycerophospho-ethanolamine acyltransferase n=1 Tax=Nocardia otitidiscaviarum TaxID=1823 RepID=A0A378Y795_9NOCA|nr:lysophospholipid acyltransferase family protein [Nocardia otitidiscaviarum]SUA72728.1 2-acyl-glycerophospho-ethanolamine acyltransferase [Nocardia otitidiscaviarum]